MRNEIFNVLKESELLDTKKMDFLTFAQNFLDKGKNIKDLQNKELSDDFSAILEKSKENSIFQLFPYSSDQHDSFDALTEVKDSVNNLNRRLLNLKKINKSLDDITDSDSALNWDDLKKISFDLHNVEDKEE